MNTKHLETGLRPNSAGIPPYITLKGYGYWVSNSWASTVLGGSWVVIGGVISPLIWVISIVTLHITLLIATHEPPSRFKMVPEHTQKLLVRRRRWTAPRSRTLCLHFVVTL